MAEKSSKAVITEIQKLQGKLDKISGNLEGMKAKAAQGKKISAKELKLTISNIDRLNMMMRERQDVGH